MQINENGVGREKIIKNLLIYHCLSHSNDLPFFHQIIKEGKVKFF